MSPECIDAVPVVIAVETDKRDRVVNVNVTEAVDETVVHDIQRNLSFLGKNKMQNCHDENVRKNKQDEGPEDPEVVMRHEVSEEDEGRHATDNLNDDGEHEQDPAHWVDGPVQSASLTDHVAVCERVGETEDETSSQLCVEGIVQF